MAGYRICAFLFWEKSIRSKGRRKLQAEARDLFCYWAARELGMTCTELANRLEKSQLGIGYAVSRGERVAQENKYQLLY